MPANRPAPHSAVHTVSPQVVITPLKPALIAGLAHTLPVLVRVQAPDADPSVTQIRRPYHLSLVIDRSGSMSGQPLAEALCALYRRPAGAHRRRLAGGVRPSGVRARAGAAGG